MNATRRSTHANSFYLGYTRDWRRAKAAAAVGEVVVVVVEAGQGRTA